MGRINRLDQHLSNMIAAGEVVERPMGIVKELVENCMDAQAKHIEVSIIQGGIDTITIIDDGIGMDQEDASLAFERHATSKLKEVDDLWNIHTMGFRGEALPSIASVSHVLLRTNNGQDSTQVEINYGEFVESKPCGTPKGTMIEVKNLFQKTPARFKHLKSPQYEFSLISDVIQKFALAHPEIGFTLSHEGKTVFQTRGNGKLLEVLMQIYGRDCAKNAIALQGEDFDYKIHGYVMQPNFNRATKYYMLLYINGRMIRNYHLQKAVTDAYAPYLPKERYPIVVVNIDMDAQLVDVNVHPSKWEIRLSKQKQLEKLIYTTISEALQTQLQVPSIATKKENNPKVELQSMSFTYGREKEVSKLHDEVNESFVKLEENPVIEDTTFAIKEEAKPYVAPKEDVVKQAVVYEKPKEVFVMKEDVVVEAQPLVSSVEVIEPVEEVKETPIVQEVRKEEPVQEELETEQEEQEDVMLARNCCLPELRVIGQFHGCYILAEGDKGLYIVDQHAAQERYHYEVIRDKILKGENDTQPLLLPLTIETNVSAVTQLADLNEAMAQIGIHLESFGDQTLVVRELPAWMEQLDEVAFIRDMIDVWEKDKEVSLLKFRKHAIATMACHSSIRFNRVLTMDEMRRVIDDLKKCEQPFHCPHGRPTLICIEDQTLIHDFERG